MRRIQEALTEKGFAARTSGQLDPPTRRALEKFQRSQHLAATGEPDLETVSRLGLDPDHIYRYGSKSKKEDVQRERAEPRR